MTNVLLVIDDSPTVRKLVELSFAREPWTLHFAATGQDGLRLIEEHRPDVVLLDYVLPDKNGAEVCAALLRQGRHQPRIVLMTAKEERIRSQFSGFPMVVDYVTKPFSAASVVAKVAAARSGSASAARATPASQASSAVLGPSDQNHALGQALYAVLRDRMNELPRWLEQAPATRPGPWLAQRLLSAETLAALAAELPASNSLGANPPPITTGDQLPLAEVLPPLELLELLTRQGRTGVLAIEGTRGVWRFALRNGQLLLASHQDPRVDLALGQASPSRADEEQLTSRTAEHLSLNVPILLAASSTLSSESLRQISTLASAAVRSVYESSRFEVRWSDQLTLDADRVAGLPGLSISQLRLELLRSRPDLASTAPASRWVRASGFSTRVTAFELTSEERRVLTIASHPVDVDEIVRETGLSVAEAERTARRLRDVSLLEEASIPLVARAPCVGIAEPDATTLRALASLLQAHCPGIQLHLTRSAIELEQALLAEPAQLVVLNASGGVSEAEHFAQRLRQKRQRPVMLAVVDSTSPSLEKDLTVLGFETVLTKPLLIDDVIAHLPGT